jgi:hypothetical protein
MLIAESVLARVLVLRGVAAADVPATQAEAQMHPRVADRQALLAPVRSAGLHVVDLVEVGADSHRVDNAVGLVFLPVGPVVSLRDVLLVDHPPGADRLAHDGRREGDRPQRAMHAVEQLAGGDERREAFVCVPAETHHPETE